MVSQIEHIRQYATPIEVQLRWSDQDVNGHVNNVRILTLMEEARIRANQQWTATLPGESGPRRVVRALNTVFDHEVQYGKATIIWVWVPKIGTSSFVVGHLLTQDGRPCVYAEATMVVIDAGTGRPTRHDDRLRSALEAHVGPAYTAHSS